MILLQILSNEFFKVCQGKLFLSMSIQYMPFKGALRNDNIGESKPSQ